MSWESFLTIFKFGHGLFYSQAVAARKMRSLFCQKLLYLSQKDAVCIIDELKALVQFLLTIVPPSSFSPSFQPLLCLAACHSCQEIRQINDDWFAYFGKQSYTMHHGHYILSWVLVARWWRLGTRRQETGGCNYSLLSAL